MLKQITVFDTKKLQIGQVIRFATKEGIYRDSLIKDISHYHIDLVFINDEGLIATKRIGLTNVLESKDMIKEVVITTI